MLSSLLGLTLAFGIGAACQYFQVPLPAPQKLTGALLVLTTTGGFVVAGYFIP